MKEVNTILEQIRKGDVKPVYILDGEESYYIDLLTEAFEKELLQPHERDFNLNVLYSRETTWAEVHNACRSYPVFAARRLVILKEADQLKQIDKLAEYISAPADSTVLVIAYHKKTCPLAKKLGKRGEHLNFMPLKEYRIPDWIIDYCRAHNLRISPENAAKLASHLGTDLQKIVNEVSKVLLNLQPGAEITAEVIEKFIGISKEYSPFEFAAALVKRDRMQAYKAMAYYVANPKSADLTVVAGSLYREFSKVYLYHFVKQKPKPEIAAAIGTSPYFVDQYATGAARYSPEQTRQALMLIHQLAQQAVGLDTADRNHNLLKPFTEQMLTL